MMSLRSRSMSRFTGFLLAAAVLTSGCATYTWQKAGVEPEAAVQDQRDCQVQARQLGFDYDSVAWAHRPWGPWAPWGWNDPFSRWGPDPGIRWDLERSAFERCMEAKGYGLVKQEKAPRS
jgi:hypothetical protein